MQLVIAGRILTRLALIAIPVVGLGAMVGLVTFQVAMGIAIFCMMLSLVGIVLTLPNRKI